MDLSMDSSVAVWQAETVQRALMPKPLAHLPFTPATLGFMWRGARTLTMGNTCCSCRPAGGDQLQAPPRRLDG